MNTLIYHLDKYVPVSQEGRPYPILCHGDQLSVERMIDAKLSMAFSEDEADQLRGLIPRPQGFHKRCIVLVWPHVDFKSIQQALSGDDDQDATSDVEDPRFQDDTLLYWDADTNSLDETMPRGEPESGDSVFNYSRAMVWRGLLHMVQTTVFQLI